MTTDRDLLLDRAPLALALVRGGQISNANGRLARILMRPQDEILGARLEQLAEAREAVEMLAEAEPILASGQVYNGEIPFMRGDHRKIWLRVMAAALESDDGAAGAVWAFEDASTHLKLLDKLNDTLAEREALLRNLRNGVLLARNRMVIWGNQQFFDMLGYAPNELIGQSTEVYFCSKEDYESIGQEGYPLLSAGKTYATEKPLRRKDGSQIWTLITGNLVDAGDPSRGYIWSFADISQRIRQEEELRRTLEHLREAQAQLVESEKMAALGGLVAGVAHEINTPVGVTFTLVTHFAQKTKQLMELYRGGQMKKSDLDRYLALSEESAAQMVANITRAADLIQSFKRVAVDQTSDERRPFNLSEYIGEILISLSSHLKKAVVKVTTDIPIDLELISYPGALAQIISNLTTNAIVHAFDRSLPDNRTAEIRIRAMLRDDGQVELRFTDNGNGVAPDHLGKLFDPFFTTKRGSGGSGLGLNIVYNLVTQKLQGRISIESQLGAGATFVMIVPRTVAETADNPRGA